MPAAITDLSQLDPNGHYTYADYLTWQFEDRVELLRGKIFPMAAPKRRHQKVSATIQNLIFNYLSDKSCEVYDAPFDVRLPVPNPRKPGSTDTVIQPDLCVVCDLTKLDDAGCFGAPDWIIELTSPRTIKKDFNEKFTLYQAAGVSEYWIIQPEDKIVHVYVLDDGRYELVDVYESGTVPCRLFPDLTIDHELIFR